MAILSCGAVACVDAPPQVTCELAPQAPTGALEDDILGTWASCFDTEDELTPWCDFRADGSLVMVTPVLTDREGVQGSVFPEGSVVTWTYSVEDQALTVYDTEGEPYYEGLTVTELTDSQIVFDPFLEMSRVRCEGPGF